VLEFIGKFLGESIVRYNCAFIHCDGVALCLYIHDHSMRQFPVEQAAPSIYRETPVRLATRPGSSFVTKRHRFSAPYKACFDDIITQFIAKAHKGMSAGSVSLCRSRAWWLEQHHHDPWDLVVLEYMAWCFSVFDPDPSWHHILIAGIQYTSSFGMTATCNCVRSRMALI
jgi:hypothetical protein